jgi:hypothetical protein
MDCVVIRKGKYFHYSYSSVRWNRWGAPTNYDIIICNDWKEGLEKSQADNKNLVLFIDSGTVFNDIEDFVEKLKTYPHQGLIGHIIDPLDKNKFYSLHPQCFLLDVKKFQSDIFDNGDFVVPDSQRSEQNIHDDYTPLWLKPGKNPSSTAIQSEFGQKIISQQICRNEIVSNWHQKIRDNKIFLYRDEIRDTWIASQKSYLDLAEQHLWVLNNQPMRSIDTNHLISPASGLFWMIGTTAENIDLVDISRYQLDLAKNLVDHWNGIDYGSFVYDFIVRRKIRHIQLDVTMSDSDKLKLLSDKNSFCKYVNDRFISQLEIFSISLDEFTQMWQQIRNKKISYNLENMVKWLLDANLSADTGIWLSNILDYKYTWIKSSDKDIEDCQAKLKKIGCRVEK